MSFRRILSVFLLTITASLAIAGRANAMSLDIIANFGPPALPVYYQPAAPAQNLLWQPGYWAWGPAGYFWVPGVWIAPPQPGLLWTPGYWGWNENVYYWHPGYWAPHIGFYGGVNYGYGYYGHGYAGGQWYGNVFRYNTAITNVNTTIIRNVYVDRTVYVNNYVNRVSYNGGPAGITAAPGRDELMAMHERHFAMTAEQREHLQTARTNRNFLATVNNGHPSFAAAARPLTRENRPADFEPVRASEMRAVTHQPARIQPIAEKSSQGREFVRRTPAPRERPPHPAQPPHQRPPQRPKQPATHAQPRRIP